MKTYNKEKLQTHYNYIFEQNKQTLLKGGAGDEYLVHPENDNRMAVALVIRIAENVSAEIEKYLNEVRKTEPELYFYPKQDLHITVLDVLRGIPYRKIPGNINDYIRCIAQAAQKVNAFDIEFNGTTASDNALLACGYYEYGLEQLRQLLRQSFSDNNLALEERYETFSSHITLARIPKKLNNPKEFVDLIQKPRYFGTMRVSSIKLMYHNWYDSEKVLLSRINLINR